MGNTKSRQRKENINQPNKNRQIKKVANKNTMKQDSTSAESNE